MFHIVIHCKPKKDNEEFYGKVFGAYASILIDYKDYNGVMELSKFYVDENGWETIEVDDEYFTFEKKEDLPSVYQQYFDELAEYGYSTPTIAKMTIMKNKKRHTTMAIKHRPNQTVPTLHSRNVVCH